MGAFGEAPDMKICACYPWDCVAASVRVAAARFATTTPSACTSHPHSCPLPLLPPRLPLRHPSP
eukprot:5709274-Prymnesium_polylepis.1